MSAVPGGKVATWISSRGGRDGLVLFAVVAVALALRLYGLNWDDGHVFHPDERHILMVSDKLTLPKPLTLDALLSAESPLNPRSFAYGSFSFYLLRLTSGFVSWLGAAVPFLSFLEPLGAYSGMRFVGRVLSASFDAGTVLLTYVLGRRLYSSGVGLLGATFVALSVLHVQLSHFFASDTLLTFFVVATLLCLVGVVRERGPRWPLLAGLMLGLGLASKASAAPLVAAVGAAYLLRVFAVERKEELAARSEWRPELWRAVPDAVLTTLAALLAFVVFQPYVVVDFGTFVRHVGEQNAMVRGVADFPYTRQYIGRPNYVYFLQNLILFGLGLPLGIAAVAGALYAALRTIRAPRFGDLLLLSWVVPYFAITGQFHAKFMRYLLPISPVLCLFAAVGLLALWRRSGGIRVGLASAPWTRPAAVALVTALVALTGLYALAFASIYARPHPAVTASRWIYERVPPGAAIATEHWEEGLPVPIFEDGRGLSSASRGYHMLALNLYERDDEAKLRHIAETIAAADYVVFYSQRLYGTIPRLPERYPMTAEYYRLLFGEQLGFELAAAFSSYPSILGVTLLDDTLSDAGLPTPALLARQDLSPVVLNLGRADESFTVYDHPRVLVFRKTRALSAAEVRARLEPTLGRTRASPESSSAQRYKSLLLTPAERAANAAGGTFSQLFDRESLGNRWPVLVWALMAQALGLAAAPLLFAVCGNLADRGYLLSKSLGVLLLAWLSWMAVSLGLAGAGGSVLLAFGFLLLGGLGALALQWRPVLAFVRERLGLILVGEAVFWGAFLVFLAIRAWNPDLWHPFRGGEKPMDLAYLTAVTKSATVPPYDPWFAGGYLNYYYFGQVIVASLVKLSGVVPTTAYNLVVPHLFALTLAGAFGVAYNLVGEERGRRRAVAGGLTAALFLGVLGNTGGGQQLAGQITRLGDFGYRSAIPGLREAAQFLLGLARVVGGQPLELRPDWYWHSTRVIDGTINEFPFFTFLFADLHAHLIALPLTLLALGLAVDAVKAKPERLPSARMMLSPGVALRAAFSALVVALVVGALMPTNSWDYPTYLGIVVLAMLVPWQRSKRRSLGALGALLLQAAAIAALSYALYLPFHESFQSFYSGLKPIGDKSTVSEYLTIHALLLAGLFTFVAVDFCRQYGGSGVVRYAGLLVRWWDRIPRARALANRLVTREDEAEVAVLILVATVLLFGALFALAGMALVGLLGVVLALVLVLALTRRRSAEETFILVLLGVGLALGITTELVAIDGDVGRMNTVFKFYLQVWVLWSVGAAVALTRAWDALNGGRALGLKRAWLGVVFALVAYSAVYPIVGTWTRVHDRFDDSIPPTLDGTAYMQTAVYHDQDRPIQLAADLAAIRWLQDNVAGSPVVLEGHAPLYRWGARVSIYTGLPTVVGWDWHQKQQRWGYQSQVDERVRDVQAMYADTSAARALGLFRRYGVAYVYVGELERIYYPAEGLAKLDRMVADGQLRLVYDERGVRIYQVAGEGTG